MPSLPTQISKSPVLLGVFLWGGCSASPIPQERGGSVQSRMRPNSRCGAGQQDGDEQNAPRVAAPCRHPRGFWSWKPFPPSAAASVESPGCINSSQQQPGRGRRSCNCNKHQSPSTSAGTANAFVACLGAKDLQLDCAVLGGDSELAEGFTMGNMAFCSCCHGKGPVTCQSCRAAEEHVGAAAAFGTRRLLLSG